MSETKTKTCNLTQIEIIALLDMHGSTITEGDINENVERIKYFNGRLKALNDEEKFEPKIEVKTEEPAPQQSTANTNVWGNS